MYVVEGRHNIQTRYSLRARSLDEAGRMAERVLVQYGKSPTDARRVVKQGRDLMEGKNGVKSWTFTPEKADYTLTIFKTERLP